jgi:hypothetical protein
MAGLFANNLEDGRGVIPRLERRSIGIEIKAENSGFLSDFACKKPSRSLMAR